MKKQEIDMCNGPLLSKILVFAIPLMLSSSLQLFFNAADTVVVGRFAGSESLAAVGSTASLIFLLTNLFLGLSIGVGVVAARFYGARNHKALSDTVHTAIAVALVSGIALLFIGMFLARFFLTLMGTPDNVMDKAVLYIRIYFLGMPAITIYNFGSTLLRAVGDTKRPLYFLTASGLVNVVLNLTSVILLHMDVAGVALATAISQCVAAALVIRSLMRSEGALKLNLRALRVDPEIFKQIVYLGVPAGMQGILFSVSNTLIQSAINSFGASAIAGNTAAANLESFIIMCMNAFYQANLTFTSQNIGGGRYDRINRILATCLAIVVVVGASMGTFICAFGRPLLHIYTQDPEVVNFGMMRIMVLCSTYFLYGMTDTIVGSLRGFGYSLVPTAITLIGMCAFRVVWVFTVFQWKHSLSALYVSFPASWATSLVAYVICLYIVRKKLPRGRVEVQPVEA